MTPRPQSLRVWVLTTLLLTIGTAASAILAAVTLEALMQRPSGGGSITTMMPGAVYTMATVMKVCVVSGGVAALATVGISITGRMGRRWDTGVEARGLPAWGLAAIALVVSTPWIGAVGAVIAQVTADTGSGLTLSDLPHISRAAVFVQLAVLRPARFQPACLSQSVSARSPWRCSASSPAWCSSGCSGTFNSTRTGSIRTRGSALS